MRTLQETIDKHFEENNTYLSSYASEVLNFDGLDFNGIAHECAEGDENVIYTNKAHELVIKASLEEQEEAHNSISNTGGYGKDRTFNEIVTSLAHWITYNRMFKELTKEKDSLIKVVEDLISKLEDRVNALEDNDPKYEEEQETLEDAEAFLYTLETL